MITINDGRENSLQCCACTNHIVFIIVCSIRMTKIVGYSGLVVRTSDSQSREPRFESSCCHFQAVAILFTPRCFSSLSCINEYLAIESGGCVFIQ